MRMLASHLEVSVPPSGTTYEDRGAVLRVVGVPGGPLELRVDEGLVFARFLSDEPRLWSPVALTSVMEFFAHDSPVATWLRTHGAFPLRQLLVDSLTSVDDAGDHTA